MKKFYLIYKITNNLNQKFYIGKHETDNLDDDYFGSGKHLKNAQNKYGIENFTKTILFYCSNREEMNLLEHYVVTPEFCQREDVYNINVGGDGGWYSINKNNTSVDRSKQQKKRFEKESEHIAISLKTKLGMKNMSDLAKYEMRAKSALTRHNKKIMHQQEKEKERQKKQALKALRKQELEQAKIRKKLEIDAKHQAYIEEVQQMADYFTKYGYDATCKKFPGRPGTCSIEAMLMRFIRARKLYGIKFKSKPNGNAKKRNFVV